jgi:hypothetical protein
MKWLWENPGPVWQWVGLAATIAGTALSLWAALAARSARDQAKRAYEAAVSLARLTQAEDLRLDLVELDLLVSYGNIEAAASKAAHFQGRIARFLADAYDQLNENERMELALAREQIGKIPSIAAGKMQAENKAARIRIAISAVSNSLGLVAGRRAAANRGGYSDVK